MTLHVKTSGSWAEVSELHVKTGGAWAEVQNAYVKDGGTWKEFYTAEEPPEEPPPTLTVVTDPPGDDVDGSGGGYTSGGTVQTSTSAVPDIDVTGHTGTLSYSWARVSGPSSYGAMSINNTATLTPRWTGWAVDGGASVETWRLTVTDSLGVTGYVDINVNLIWVYIE
jgi:hypothetical protein